MTGNRIKVLVANGALIGFPVLTAHLIREYATDDIAISFLLVLSYINSIGLLDLGTTRAVLLKQEMSGSWRDLIGVIVVLAVAGIAIVNPQTVFYAVLLLLVGVCYWIGGLFRSLLERELRLEREALHRLVSSIVILIAAVIAIVDSLQSSILVLLFGKALAVFLLGSSELGAFFQKTAIPKVGLSIAAPALLAFVITNLDRVAASRLLEGQIVADYLFFSLMFQRGIAVFASVLPTYLHSRRLTQQDISLPLSFASATIVAVICYTLVFVDIGQVDDMYWIVILCLAYFVNIATAPILGRNLHRAKHKEIAASYACQIPILIIVIYVTGGTLVGLSLAVLVRSCFDFVLQLRIGHVRQAPIL
jgi:hypothetical protein